MLPLIIENRSEVKGLSVFGVENSRKAITKVPGSVWSRRNFLAFFFSFSLHGGADRYGSESAAEAAEKFLLKNGCKRVLNERNDRQPVAT